MKTKMPILLLSLLVGAASIACNSPDKAQKGADQAQQESNDQAAKAQREADKQKMEGESNAQQKQEQATLALTSAKTDYHAKIAALLIDVEKRRADLRASSTTSDPAHARDTDAKLATLTGKKDVLLTDAGKIDLARAGDWDALQAQLDKDINDLRMSIMPVVGKT